MHVNAGVASPFNLSGVCMEIRKFISSSSPASKQSDTVAADTHSDSRKRFSLSFFSPNNFCFGLTSAVVVRCFHCGFLYVYAWWYSLHTCSTVVVGRKHFDERISAFRHSAPRATAERKQTAIKFLANVSPCKSVEFRHCIYGRGFISQQNKLQFSLSLSLADSVCVRAYIHLFVHKFGVEIVILSIPSENDGEWAKARSESRKKNLPHTNTHSSR